MIELESKQLDVAYKINGDINITFVLDKHYKDNIEQISELFVDDSIKTLKIDKKRNKRSLNANNYAWKLISEMANVLRTSNEEIYLQMLKSYGQMVTISIEEKAVDTFLKSIQYAEVFAEGEVNKKLFKHVHVWIGSSQYDTQQMSIFIDGIVSECVDLKICTLTPAEIEKIKNNWRIKK